MHIVRHQVCVPLRLDAAYHSETRERLAEALCSPAAPEAAAADLAGVFREDEGRAAATVD